LYHTLRILLAGVLDSRRINPVNAGNFLERVSR
jgi:hypothetical protein